jgi:hypothetical protein
MRKLISYLSIITSVILLTNCEGKQGEDGLQGPKGDKGYANVQAVTYDVAPNSWKGDTNGYVATLTVPEIDQKIFENGAVLVYMLKHEQFADKSFNILPYTWIDNYSTEYMDYDVFIGKIAITIRWIDNGINSTSAPDTNYAFKVIIIEGTPLSVLKTEVDIYDYNAVLAYSFKSVHIQ